MSTAAAARQRLHRKREANGKLVLSVEVSEADLCAALSGGVVTPDRNSFDGGRVTRNRRRLRHPLMLLRDFDFGAMPMTIAQQIGRVNAGLEQQTRAADFISVTKSLMIAGGDHALAAELAEQRGASKRVVLVLQKTAAEGATLADPGESIEGVAEAREPDLRGGS